MYEIEFLGRYFHVLAGIVWIGMLYYFNFVQTEYFKEAEAGAKTDAMAKLGASSPVVVPLGRHAHLPDRCLLISIKWALWARPCPLSGWVRWRALLCSSTSG